MSWTRTSDSVTNPSWHVTDLEIIKRLQYMLLENGGADADGVTFLTSMFGLPEIIAYLNERQQKFLRDTGAIQVRATQATTPGQVRYALPPDWISTRRLDWTPLNQSPTALSRVDAFQMDTELSDWEQNTGTPSVYDDSSTLPTLTVAIAKAPATVGMLVLNYTPLPTQLDGSGIPLTIPDEMESAILYGTLADLLGSDGEMHDPERAAYCEARYQICVGATRALMGLGDQMHGQ